MGELNKPRGGEPTSSPMGVRIMPSLVSKTENVSDSDGPITSISAYVSESTRRVISIILSVNTWATIDDYTGEGVLTHVMGPQPYGVGEVIDIRVTYDGTVVMFSGTTITKYDRFYIGAFVPEVLHSDVADPHGSSQWDIRGYFQDPDIIGKYSILSPTEAVSGNYGIPFKESCKVEVRASKFYNSSTFKKCLSIMELTNNVVGE